MKFEIKNRWTGKAQFSTELPAEIVGEKYSLQLGFAVKKAAETRANLAGNLGRQLGGELHFATPTILDFEFHVMPSFVPASRAGRSWLRAFH